ncbi:hypothetical protein NPIL_617991 [Nephila pilipes]|uniref:Uncharacterized protein n=1 Tax=Nephila pilipes TaxID=299642 RepID=A0A8X6MUF2_NEPPI|nr:hypothetical protein NPIL_617991 [Nephila pilipes]
MRTLAGHHYPAMALRDSDDFLTKKLSESGNQDFSEEELGIGQFPPGESDRSSEEDIDDNVLSLVVPANVWVHLSIITNNKSK